LTAVIERAPRLSGVAAFSPALILAAGFCFGLLGEGFAFLHRQLAAVDASLSSDFKAIATTSGAADPQLEARLRGLRGVAGVRRVSSDDALARLKSEDPELAEALAAGPKIPDAFELELSAEALPRLSSWAIETRAAEPGLAVKYKAEEAEAILQVRFYEHFLAAACGLAGLGLAGVAGAMVNLEFGRRFLHQWSMGAAGAVFGAAAGLFLAWQLRASGPAWAWPAWGVQAMTVLLGGFIATSARRTAR
jgi:hypothetical protein